MALPSSISATVKLRGEDAGGALSVVDVSAAADFGGPPLHHHAFDETFCVVEGELTFRLRDELVTAGPGDVVFAPRDVPHTLTNRSGAPARYLLVCTPPGFERYFAGEPGDWPEVVVDGPPIGA